MLGDRYKAKTEVDLPSIPGSGRRSLRDALPFIGCLERGEA
jgi:hypothetical protein